MNNSIRWGLIISAAAVVVAGMTTCEVNAQDQEHDHAKNHNFYKEWKQPRSPTTGCCNVRVENEHGNVTGDCYRTVAKIAPSAKPELKGVPVWWALRKYGKNPLFKERGPHWIEIDDRDIVREKNPDASGIDAHLCQGDYAPDDKVLCFKEPVGAL